MKTKDCEEYDCDQLYGTLKELKDLVTRLIAKHGMDARIDFPYDFCDRFEVWWEREETESELAFREGREEAGIKRKTEREKRQLVCLLKKYGTP